MPASQPRVIAIVVNHNGRAFLRDTFRGLAAQTRPIDDVLVVDTGSTDGSADWARSRLGDDAVMAVRGQFGRAVMSALRDPRTSGMDWLWLLHDDCAPEPEALERLLAEAESRPSASILGPKLVSWTNPDRLQEIGFSIDRTGRAVSPIEDDEIDQGQHDQIRDVFYVNTAGMLVRRGALLNVGGFDERMPAFRDDLDLCWRTHLTGGRVLVVPQARVRHFAAASSRSRRTRAVGHPRYLIERHTAAAMLKATSLRKLPLALLLALVGALVRSASLALTGRPADALAVLWAWGWNIKELPVTIVHRRRLQKQRKVDDSALAPLRAPGGQHLRSMLRGTLELVYGAEVGAHVAQRTDESGEEVDMPSTGTSVLRVVASHPVAFMVAGFALVMAVSLRSVLFAPAIASISLGVFPATATELLREFVSSFHQAQMGSTASAPPSLALLGGLSVLTFGKALVAEKLLLWLALPLAAATCTRALRVVVPELWARAVAGLLYATAPLATGALAQGRIGELVLLVVAPPALAQVVLAFRAEQPREPWRPALRFALLAAVAIAMAPAAAVSLGLVVAAAIAVALVRAGADGRRAAARQSLLLALGFGLAVLLLLPWSGRLLTGAVFADLGRPLATPGLADLLQLRPGGGGMPGPLVGPIYLALAVAALLFVPADRRKQTFWLLGRVRGGRPGRRLAGQGAGPADHRLAGRAAGARGGGLGRGRRARPGRHRPGPGPAAAPLHRPPRHRRRPGPVRRRLRPVRGRPPGPGRLVADAGDRQPGPAGHRHPQPGPGAVAGRAARPRGRLRRHRAQGPDPARPGPAAGRGRRRPRRGGDRHRRGAHPPGRVDAAHVRHRLRGRAARGRGRPAGRPGGQAAGPGRQADRAGRRCSRARACRRPPGSSPARPRRPRSRAC